MSFRKYSSVTLANLIVFGLLGDVVRHLKGEDLTSLNPKDLIPIEEALQNGLDRVRNKEVRDCPFPCFPLNLLYIGFNKDSDDLYLFTCYRWTTWWCWKRTWGLKWNNLNIFFSLIDVILMLMLLLLLSSSLLLLLFSRNYLICCIICRKNCCKMRTRDWLISW